MANFLLGNVPWEPWLAGEAKYLLRPVRAGQDGEAGLWRGTPKDLPAKTRVRYKRAELIYVIEGCVLLEVEGGEARELRSGEGAFFAVGDCVHWTILTPTFEEFYVYFPRPE